MENKFFKKFDDVLKIEVTGRNIDNYIKKLVKAKINIIKLVKVDYKTIYIYVNYEDYLKIKRMKTIYSIKVISKLGGLRLKYFIKRNIIMFSFIILSIILLFILSNIIFSIDVIHSDSKLKKLIYQQLEYNGIKKYRFKKSYDELEKIEDKILEDNKDKLEWIEIIESGTKYIIRLEERLLNEEEDGNDYQNIVASKSAIITDINAIVGEKVKNINDYVAKGDIIISGNIIKPDNSSILKHASGSVLGEVWYTVNVEYPFIYKEETLTGKSKKVLVLNFFNKRISLFDFNKFNSFKSNKKVLLYNNFLPINLTYEKQYEVNVIDEFLTEEEAINEAINIAKDKLVKNNDKIIKIKDVSILNEYIYPSKVKLKLFVSVIEDIGIESKITDIESENSNQ